ncbi:MAG: hypothetical protein ACOH2N_04235 [Devosia sp.]
MLTGQTILIVEEEFLIALDIQGMLEALVAGQMLFARSTVEAHQSEPHWPSIDLAIVEIGPDEATLATLLEGLRAAGIAIILTTTDSALRKGHPAYPGAPVLVKPMVDAELRAAVTLALAGESRTSDCVL